VAKRRTRSSESGRFMALVLVFGFMFVLVGARLVWVQVVQAPKYSAMAAAQRMRDIQVPARRGTIYDREGEPLAKSMPASTIYAAPNLVKDKVGVANLLESVLGGDRQKYLDSLSRDKGFVYIALKVDMNRARQLQARLQALNLTGIGFLDDSRRVYPSGDLASQVLGYVSREGTGTGGIEKRYDKILAGTPGLLLGERDPFGRPIPGGVQKNEDPIDGHDIVLTIDKDIQYHAQLELAKAVKNSAAKSGSIVIMNPRNGEIYAMASVPSYDPNNLTGVKPEALRNQPIWDTYEPGSTMKSVTSAAAIDKGILTPKSKFHLPPTIRVGGYTIHDAEKRGTVNWSLSQIVTNSSNVGAVKVGMRLGKRSLYDYFARFGLTTVTGVDFPREMRGWLPVPSQWSAVSIANFPFGQGVSATPLQLCRALCGIANGGVMPTPHFLLDVPQDKSAQSGWPMKRAISAKAAATTTSMLMKVVTEGTGKAAKVPGYDVAGKTGTAQVAVKGLGYKSGKHIASFIGFLPAENPQLLICVKIDEPQKGYYGGAVAAPVFATLGKFCAAHLKIAPTAPAKAHKKKASSRSESTSASPGAVLSKQGDSGATNGSKP
jgi:cell division protein FtsI/penicillin-binding protein 2